MVDIDIEISCIFDLPVNAHTHMMGVDWQGSGTIS